MKSAAMRRSMRETLADYEKYGEWWPRILDRISGGGSVTDICAEHVLYVGLFVDWVQADSIRFEQYQDALELRAERRLTERQRRRAELRSRMLPAPDRLLP